MKNDTRTITMYNARRIRILTMDIFFDYIPTKIPLASLLFRQGYFSSARVSEMLYPKYTAIARSLLLEVARVVVLEPGVLRSIFDHVEIYTNNRITGLGNEILNIE